MFGSLRLRAGASAKRYAKRKQGRFSVGLCHVMPTVCQTDKGETKDHEQHDASNGDFKVSLRTS